MLGRGPAMSKFQLQQPSAVQRRCPGIAVPALPEGGKAPTAAHTLDGERAPGFSRSRTAVSFWRFLALSGSWGIPSRPEFYSQRNTGYLKSGGVFSSSGPGRAMQATCSLMVSWDLWRGPANQNPWLHYWHRREARSYLHPRSVSVWGCDWGLAEAGQWRRCRDQCLWPVSADAATASAARRAE